MSSDVVRLGNPDAPAVVIVPELAVSARQLRPLTDAWTAAGRRVIVIDLYGRSRPPFDYTDVIAQEIPDAVAEAGRGALLAGYGFGGHLSLFAAASLDTAPPVATIAAGIPSDDDAAKPTLLERLGLGDLAKLGDVGRVFGAKRDSIAVGGIADLARLAEVRTRVLAVAIDDDRTMPAAAVDRLADQLDVPVVRVDVATGAKPDAHLRWVAASPGHVVTAIEAWAAGSVG